MSKELLDVLGLREQYQQGRDLLGSLNKIETEASGLLSHLYDEVRSGLWRDKGMLNAVRQEQQQHALRRKDVAAFIAAHDDKHELPLAIWPSKRADASLPSGENMLQLLEFFDKAIESSDPEDPRPAFWTTSLLREAKLHLYDLLADDMRQQARVAWEPVIDTLRGKLVNRKNDVLPLALRDWRVEIYGQLLDMRYQLGDLDAFEAIYDEFRGLYRFADQEEIVLSDGFASTYHAFIQRNKGASPLFPWFVSMLRFPKQYVRLFVLLLQQIITVKSLRHNSCDYDLMYLQQLHADMHARWRKIGVEAVSLTGAELSLDKATPSAPASILPSPAITRTRSCTSGGRRRWPCGCCAAISASTRPTPKQSHPPARSSAGCASGAATPSSSSATTRWPAILPPGRRVPVRCRARGSVDAGGQPGQPGVPAAQPDRPPRLCDLR